MFLLGILLKATIAVPGSVIWAFSDHCNNSSYSPRYILYWQENWYQPQGTDYEDMINVKIIGMEACTKV